MRVMPYSLYDRLLPCLTRNADFNQAIAMYVLKHLSEIPTCSIFQLAKQSHVSPSSVSRFVQKIGFEDYTEFRDYVEEELGRNDVYSFSHPVENRPFSPPYSREQLTAFFQTLPAMLEHAFSTQTCRMIETLCQTMKAKPNVYFLGLRSMRMVMEHIANELMPFGLVATMIGEPKEITTPRETNALVLFSMHGHYFRLKPPQKKQELVEKSDAVFVISQTGNAQGLPLIRLGKCATSWADSIVWTLLAEQVVYTYKFLA